ncbi:MAG: hypothetical protein IJO05_05185 [Oscillospiraceae bacterium]|nr:hypothetical protein [Oscillospiraceae bacterium]
MQRAQTEPYLSRFLHNRGAKPGLPVSGSFELTARCNFRCPMCYVHMDQEQIDSRGRELTAQQWIALAQEAADQGMTFALPHEHLPLRRLPGDLPGYVRTGCL